ncbi:MAG: hypothetical protein HN600_10350, partial [Bacteroidetes bacterium]|nr:hypothetical protein [Bacteroidota bacterium]
NQCGLTHGGTIRTENSGTNKTEITGTDSPKWLAWFDPKYPSVINHNPITYQS